MWIRTIPQYTIFNVILMIYSWIFPNFHTVHSHTDVLAYSTQLEVHIWKDIFFAISSLAKIEKMASGSIVYIDLMSQFLIVSKYQGKYTTAYKFQCNSDDLFIFLTSTLCILTLIFLHVARNKRSPKKSNVSRISCCK